RGWQRQSRKIVQSASGKPSQKQADSRVQRADYPARRRSHGPLVRDAQLGRQAVEDGDRGPAGLFTEHFGDRAHTHTLSEIKEAAPCREEMAKAQRLQRAPQEPGYQASHSVSS